MKKSFATIVVCFFSIVVRSQFGPVFFIDTLESEAIAQIRCADFNHDGLEDVLAANLRWPKDNIKLYLQSGDQAFSYQAIPDADSLAEFESFDVGDVYKDGWTDFIVANEFPWRITVYENDHGTFIPHIVDDSLDFTSDVMLADFNHDGLLDILSLQHVEIVVYLATGEGIFGPPQVIHSGTEFYAIDAAHYNQDTFLDISVASDGFDILLNDGAGHFDIIESTHIGLTFHLQSADLDGDSDTDIAAYESLRGILFYSNDSDGHFVKEDTILESSDIFDTFLLEDMDCDGDIDVYTSVPQIGNIIIVENDGNAEFDTLVQIHVQTGELVRAVTTGDLNDDGKPDPIWGYFTLGAELNECTTVSVEENAENNAAVNIYPNPSNGTFTIENNEESTIYFSVFDNTGREIDSFKSILPKEHMQYNLVHPGVYYVQVIGKEGHLNIEKIIMINNP